MMAAAAALGVVVFWKDRPVVVGAEIGVAAAWAASAASVGWILYARTRSPRAFWRAFGGGIALRAAVAAALAAWGWRRPEISLSGLLLSYAFVLTALQITLDYRHLRLK